MIQKIIEWYNKDPDDFMGVVGYLFLVGVAICMFFGWVQGGDKMSVRVEVLTDLTKESIQAVVDRYHKLGYYLVKTHVIQGTQTAYPFLMMFYKEKNAERY